MGNGNTLIAMSLKRANVADRQHICLTEDEYYDNIYDRASEQDLKDELNYIRQNGGDWIDD